MVLPRSYCVYQYEYGKTNYHHTEEFQPMEA